MINTLLNEKDPREGASSRLHDTYLSAKEICEEFGFSRMTLYNSVKRGLLPEGERVAARAVRWRRSVVLDAVDRLNRGRRIRLDGAAE